MTLEIHETEAAGRTLSKGNVEKAKLVMRAIYELLTGSGVITDKEIADELGMSLPTYAPISSTSPDPPTPSEVEAMRLKERVDLATWGERLESVLKEFKQRFCMVHKADRDSLTSWVAKELKADKDTSLPSDPAALRKALVSQMRQDLNEILDALSADAPEVGDRWLPEIDATRAELTQIAATAAEALETQPETHRVVLGRSSLSLPTNRREFRGVLFAIDKPSQAAPEGLGGLPLLVSRSVAEAAARNVAGLPLNAAADLSRHDKPNVIGHMKRADIVGADFVVEGHLYDHNRPELTTEIAANASDLGMSLEAYIKGAQAQVAGQTVFVASEMILTGATIARQDRVAFGSDTRVLAATTAEPEAVQTPVLVTATQPDQPTQLEIDMDNSSEIKAQLDSLTALVTKTAEAVGGLADRISVVATAVEQINAEREIEAQKAAEVQAQQAAEAERAAEQKRLEEIVAAAVAKVAPVTATRPATQRQTVTPVAIAAAGGTGETLSVAAQIDREIHSVQAQLNLLDSLPTYDSVTAIRLTEQLRDLQQKRSAVPA